MEKLQRFSIRKLSIGAVSCLIGTVTFLGYSHDVQAAEKPQTVETAKAENEIQSEKAQESKPTEEAKGNTQNAAGSAAATVSTVGVAENSTENDDDPVDVAGDSTKNDAYVNNTIDKYAQGKQKELQKELGDDAPLIRASDKQPVTVDTLGRRAHQVVKIENKINSDIKQAEKDNESIEKYKKDHPQTVNGKESDFFRNQGLSIDDEKDSKINQISVDHKINQVSVDHKDFTLKGITLLKDQSKKIGGIDGIDVTYTNKMTNKEKKSMDINSDNKVIIDLQHDQCQGTEITVTYDNLNNSYYLENIDDKTNKIKISKIKRTFSVIRPDDNTIFTSDGSTPTSNGDYDECHGPQLIIYNDPSDGFFYNNIRQVSVKDIYYDDKGKEVSFKNGDKNKAWIFVTSLNSDGHSRWDKKTYIEKVKAEIKAENSDPTPADIEELDGSTVTEENAVYPHHGWWYSDLDNGSYNGGPYTGLAWDNNSEDNRYAFVGAVAIKYQPGLTITYGADDNAWGSHWVCTQTQLVSTLNRRVIIYNHIVDDTENVTGNDDVNMTVHYVMDDGSTAPSDSKQTVNFTETGVKDKVTGKIAWTPADSQTLNNVTSPVLTGYTADIKTAKGKAVNFGDPDINVTVTYHANAQTAKITYIDDTIKNNLDSKDTSGKFGQAIAFATAPSDEIANYKKQGYVLVSNSFDNNKYQADNSKNVFYVHLKHKIESVTRNDTVTRTIHYLYDNGDTAQPDKTQTVSFNETGTKDDVTNKTTWSNDNAQTVNSVNTPSITGYTPNKSSIEGQSFKFGDKNVEVTVTYHANAQTAKITYIDDTTKNNLDSKDANGKFGQTITFEHDPAAKIASYEKQGYVLVSNSFNNQTYAADNNNNVFYVHLKHKTENVTRNDTVTRTIHYLYDNGNTAQPDKTQTVSFNETGTKDDVIGETTWSNDNAQTVDSVDTPSITGYTPDKSSIEKQSFKFGDQDIEVTVTYHANAQTATITYIDDTDKKTLGSDSQNGKFNQAITFEHDPTAKIASYKKQGYVLVSNSFDNNKYQADDNNNVFYVHLKHNIESVTRNDTVTRIIHYLYDNGDTAQPDKTQTVSFNETGTKDDVTGETTWSNDNAQTVGRVNTPNITGYTPDKSSIEGRSFKFGDQDVEATVTYHPNAQTATITYIDDTDKKTLGSDSQNGKFNQAITFEHDPADETAKYEKQGYKLVSNDFNNNKYQADNSKNVFYVHFVHNTKKVNREHSASFTVHYIYKDSKQAKPDHKQTLSFTENGTQDLVTQKTTWIPANSQKFDDAATPVITGYTPDQDKVIGQTANFETTDREVTVTYLPDVQLGHINYIDDNTGKTLTRDDFSGRTNEHEDYTSIDRIQEFENKGYVFVSSDYPDGGFNFDDNDQQDQVFNVHLKHGIVTVTTKNPQIPNTTIDPDPQSPKYPKDISNTNSDVKRTIDYKFKDGKTAKPTVNDSLHFERTVVIDKVTGDVLSDTWTPNQDFNDVQTPIVQGYTPNITVVSDKNIGHDHQDIVEHVVYSPDTQHMTITYIDDTTDETLHTDNPNGVSDQDANYTTTDIIKQYEEKHYKLVSDSTNGQDLIFDHDDNVNQTYEVHFVHNTHTINQTTSPKQTIHYVYANGLARHGKAADDNVQQLSFTRDGYNDEVTGIDHWNAWTSANSQYKAVDSPVIQGYTPDKLVVEKSTVNPTDKDTEITVVYNADKQHMTITYIDDTTGKELHTDNPTGVSDQDAKYTTSDTIKKYEEQHYKMVSDSTNGKDLIFDHDDNANQTYEVHFVHNTHTINQTTSPKQTIHYVYADDLARQGKAADDNVQKLSFKRDGYNDEVTGIDHWNAWTPANSQYEAVDSPVIQGYTPNKSVIEKSTVNPTDKDTEITIVYNADKQTAHVIYIDKTTNTTLTSNNLSGKSDKDSGYNTKDTIEKYQSQHYVLTGDETNGDNVIFDHDDQQDQTYYVYFAHGMQNVSRQDTVTSTIDYKFEDGQIAQPTVTQTKQFSEDGVKDLVTGKITWAKAEPQKFDDVATKSIVGYTPDKDTVTGSTVNFGDKDVEVTVTYHNNAQTAKITYVDDMTKKTLASDSQDGKFGHEITFEHDPAEVIKGFEEKGYKLVSNDFNGDKYQADNSKNVFYVHFVHGSHDISDKKAITETITYRMSDGSKAPDKVEKQVEFSRVGKHDEVTNTDTWNEWQPDKQSFDVVPTPDVKGYTPDTKLVEAKIVTVSDKDIDITIIYTPNKQKAKVVFIDDTTKKILDTHDLIGVTNGHEKYNPSEEIEKFIHDNYVFVSSDYPKEGFTYDNDDSQDQVFEIHLKERPGESDTPTIPGNTEDNGGSSDTPTADSDEPEKDNGGSDTVDKSNHKTPVKRNDNKKHHSTKKTNIQKNANKKPHGTKKTNIQKTSKTAKLNPNRFVQSKLGKVQESANQANRSELKHDALPQTGEKHNSLMAMLGLVISSLGLGMIGLMKSKKRKDK